MINRVRILGVTAALVASAALGSTTGIARTGNLGKQAPDVQSAKPSGYLIVSAGFSAPNGQETGHSVACPATKKGVTREPLGGGVLIASNSLSANVNSSYPSGTSWSGFVNNNSGADISFTVYAICAKPHKHYQVVGASIDNPPGTKTTGFAACPHGTTVTGGGAISSSVALGVNINTSVPYTDGWRVDANNAGAGSNTLTTYVVCSAGWDDRTGWVVVSGTHELNSAGTETEASVLCPSGRSVLGGGGFSDGGSTAVNMNATHPFTGGWTVFENNASASDQTITAYAICAT
jgi:hypothetical protein